MRKKILLVKTVVCVLALALLFVTGCGKKGKENTLVDSKQEESTEEDDKDLPILSNDGEELDINEDAEETPKASGNNADSSTKDSASNLGNTSENEPEQGVDGEEEKEPEKDSDDEKEEDNKPVELPFVPADKLK